MIRMSKEQVISKFNESISVIEQLLKGTTSIDSDQFIQWRRNTEVLLKHVFGKDSDHLKEFKSIRFYPIYTSDDPYRRQEQIRKEMNDGLSEARSILNSMIKEIEDYNLIDDTDVNEKYISNNRIFIVYGHDRAVRSELADFLRKMELEPVILEEKPSGSNTIIEQIEENADVGFAIVLLTADDEGFPKGKKEEIKYRARQNVILELGYMMGKLGRNRVKPLKESDLEVPSDIHGVVYTPLDIKGAWKQALIKELKRAGYKIDANKVFE